MNYNRASLSLVFLKCICMYVRTYVCMYRVINLLRSISISQSIMNFSQPIHYLFIIGRFRNQSSDHYTSTLQTRQQQQQKSISKSLHSSPSLWFQSNAMYNTMTGHEVGSSTTMQQQQRQSQQQASTSTPSKAEPKGR